MFKDNLLPNQPKLLTFSTPQKIKIKIKPKNPKQRSKQNAPGFSFGLRFVPLLYNLSSEDLVP